jgi:gliding motility-associated lipoprotein GldD
MKFNLVQFSFLILIFFFASCREETFTPKPRGYYSIQFPEKKYQLFNKADYPYSFEFPVYGMVEKDSMFFEKKAENPWWININFPTLEGKIFISYKEISAYQPLSQLIEDSYKMSHYHSKRADYINDSLFHTTQNVHGQLYNVGGNSASAYQFIATDSVKHFLRGALYFDTTPNVDSLLPIQQFLYKDISHFIKTLNWTR